MQQPFVTYILTNKEHDQFYAGATRDLEFAVSTHKQGIADIFTRDNQVNQLVWFETSEDLISVLRHKIQLAELPTDEKIDLIEKQNPDWQDLMEEDKRAKYA